jgi:cytochrome c oxidase subunit 4
MSEHTAEEIRRHVRVYLYVFAALAALTVITVAVSYVHLGLAGNVAVALVIAVVKGSLVACFFMHLISERKMLYGILLLTVVFFAVLMLLPLGSEADQQGEHLQAPAPAPTEGHVH